MFDIGFLELLVISVIALIVLGPERLPKAARTVGLWVGKAKQSFNSVKVEIDRELKAQEIQQQLNEQKENLESQLGLESVQKTLSETQQSIDQIDDSLAALKNNTSAQDETAIPTPDNKVTDNNSASDKSLGIDAQQDNDDTSITQ